MVGAEPGQRAIVGDMGAHEIDEDVLEPAPAAQLVDRPLGDEVTEVHDTDPIAQPLDHFHHVAREHDRVAGVGEALEHGAQRARRDRIDRLERLVEEEHRGAVQQRGRERDLLAHAGAVVDDEGVGGVASRSSTASNSSAALGDERRRHAAQQTAVLEELGAGQTVEQPELVGQHSDARLRGDRVEPHVVALDPHLTAVGSQQRGQHADHRRLAGAVRPDEPEEARAGDVEVDAGDRDLLVVALPQPSHHDGRPAADAPAVPISVALS